MWILRSIEAAKAIANSSHGFSGRPESGPVGVAWDGPGEWLLRRQDENTEEADRRCRLSSDTVRMLLLRLMEGEARETYESLGDRRAGFIGSRCGSVTSRGHDVVVVDNLVTGKRKTFPKRSSSISWTSKIPNWSGFPQ